MTSSYNITLAGWLTVWREEVLKILMNNQPIIYTAWTANGWFTCHGMQTRARCEMHNDELRSNDIEIITEQFLSSPLPGPVIMGLYPIHYMTKQSHQMCYLTICMCLDIFQQSVLIVQTLWPSDAIWRHGSLSSLLHAVTFRLFCSKPPHEPVRIHR